MTYHPPKEGKAMSADEPDIEEYAHGGSPREHPEPVDVTTVADLAAGGRRFDPGYEWHNTSTPEDLARGEEVFIQGLPRTPPRPGVADQPSPAPGRPGRSIQGLVRKDLAEREQVGTERYGTPLQAFNGRDPLVDLYQEILDAACYLRQMIEEQRQHLPVVAPCDDPPRVLMLHSCGEVRWQPVGQPELWECIQSGGCDGVWADGRGTMQAGQWQVLYTVGPAQACKRAEKP